MKYALFINGVADTIANKEPLEKVGSETYQVQVGVEEFEVQIGEVSLVDPDTGAVALVPVMEKRSRPKFVTRERDIMARAAGFIEVPDDVLPGFLQIGEAFVPPPPVLADVQARKLGELERLAAQKRARIAGTSDGLKVAVYEQKYQVARAAEAGDEEALAVLAPEAAARGETSAELAALVVRLGNQWKLGGLAIDANYQTLKQALLRAPTVGEIEAVDLSVGWPV